MWSINYLVWNWRFFSLIFYVIIVNENQAITAVHQPKADDWRGEGGWYINEIGFGVLEDRQDHFWLCQVFIFISSFPRTIKSFTLLDTDQNHSNLVNRLSFAVDEIYMSGDDLGSKFGYAPNWGRGCWEVKNAKIIYIWANRWRIQSCLTYRKINLSG